MVQTFVAQFVERPDIDYYDSVVVDLPNLLDDASFQVFAQIHAKGKRHFGIGAFLGGKKTTREIQIRRKQKLPILVVGPNIQNDFQGSWLVDFIDFSPL
jgi:hypothetical protein